MSREKLEIRKGGKLIETKWIYDKVAKQGAYHDIDRTDQAIRNLFEVCELAPDVTLKDIFLLLNSEIDIFDAVIGNWCKEIVTEGLTAPEKPYDLNVYDPEQIEYLELRFTPEYESDGDGTEDYLQGFTRPDFGGTGVELRNDGDQEHYSKGDRIPWGISFTPANELINIPVRLAKDVAIYEGILKSKSGQMPNKLAEFKNPSFTLGQILEGIIWEMSFHGGPDKRDAFNKDLRETVDKIKSGEENLHTGQSFEDYLKEQNDDTGDSNPT